MFCVYDNGSRGEVQRNDTSPGTFTCDSLRRYFKKEQAMETAGIKQLYCPKCKSANLIKTKTSLISMRDFWLWVLFITLIGESMHDGVILIGMIVTVLAFIANIFIKLTAKRFWTIKCDDCEHEFFLDKKLAHSYNTRQPIYVGSGNNEIEFTSTASKRSKVGLIFLLVLFLLGGITIGYFLYPKLHVIEPGTNVMESANDTITQPAEDTSIVDVNDEYVLYMNPRFNFNLLIPKSFETNPPPENGDGQSFSSQRRETTILAYGGYNVDNNSLTQQMNAIISYNPKCNFTYKYVKNDFFILSGIEGNEILYIKSIYNRAENSFISVHIRYPLARKDEMNDIVTTISQSIKIGNR